MVYKARLTSQASKFLDKLEGELYNRILTKMEKMEKEPFPKDVKRVIGRQDKVFRIRVGKYRIIYIVIPEANELVILDVDKRDSVYD